MPATIQPNERRVHAAPVVSSGPTTATARFPSTRYQGSKRKLAGAIIDRLAHLDYATVLDAFGGTGVMAYEFKRLGKEVTYNDALPFSLQIGRALIENDGVQLSEAEIGTVAKRRPGARYGDVIEHTFDGIYFHKAENRWLDTAAANILRLRGRFKRAMAWYAVFQSALVKRPYNLFHRRNLYMRTADVPRGFGNKATWDRSFDDHFRTFAAEANAAVFQGARPCQAICRDAVDVQGEYDLVYIDPPYINSRGVGVDYARFYHFLTGLVQYERWAEMVDFKSKNRALLSPRSPWCDPNRFRRAFLELIDRFRHSQIAVSYRSEGFPGPCDLAAMLKQFKPSVQVCEVRPYRYVLSSANGASELLFIGT